MAAKVKTGDKVVVLAGKDKGRTGEVTRVLPKRGKAVVDGVNVAVRHTRQSQTSRGGRIPQPMPMDLSNLAVADPKTDKPTRVGFRFDDQGRKVRFAKKSGAVIDA